jgi:hypothetical protein
VIRLGEKLEVKLWSEILNGSDQLWKQDFGGKKQYNIKMNLKETLREGGVMDFVTIDGDI